MTKISEMKKRGAKHWDDIIASNSSSHLVVSTMDVFVKRRAGQLKGYAQRLLGRLQISLFCMEEFESFDLPQVVATLVMVSDVFQRVEICGRVVGALRSTEEVSTQHSLSLPMACLKMANTMKQRQ